MVRRLLCSRERFALIAINNSNNEIPLWITALLSSYPQGGFVYKLGQWLRLDANRLWSIDFRSQPDQCEQPEYYCGLVTMPRSIIDCAVAIIDSAAGRGCQSNNV